VFDPIDKRNNRAITCTLILMIVFGAAALVGMILTEPANASTPQPHVWGKQVRDLGTCRQDDAGPGYHRNGFVFARYTRDRKHAAIWCGRSGRIMGWMGCLAVIRRFEDGSGHVYCRGHVAARYGSAR
jgi:hypothetical protein